MSTDNPATPPPGKSHRGGHTIPTERLPGFVAEQKAVYVNRMFAQIAPRYDFMNRLMTFGLDEGWRREVVKAADLPHGGLALDIATGTGDIALALARAGGLGTTVIASDFCREMMETGPAKAERTGVAGRVSFEVADALNLPYPDNTFDCATIGFGIRNVTDISRAFQEMRRVVKPGGRVVCLEVARPTFAPVRWGHQLYFNKIVPILGRIFSQNVEAYTYLPESARNFPTAEQLAAILEEAGLETVTFRRYGLGAVAIHKGLKPV